MGIMALCEVSHPDDVLVERRLALHRRLARRNEHRLTPAHDVGSDAFDLEAEAEDRRAEEEFVSGERAALTDSLRDLPSDVERFMSWFERLRETGPGQHDPLFAWLAEECTLADMRWFLGQELAGEAGFEDLLAFTQVKMPVRVKLEMARNYWDEMGRGRRIGMHGPMLERLAETLSARLSMDQIVWESLALGNLMVALAWNRRYAYQAVGALGVVELTAPDRAKQVNAGLRRLGVGPEARKYFAMHATLDIKHSAAWNQEVLRPLVEADDRAARAIAEGALMRLGAGARCFAAYRDRLCVSESRFKASRSTSDSFHR
jgi:Iron-containing redox enzyme